MGVTALILGIVSVVIAVFFNYIGWLAAILGVVGIIFGALARKNGARGVATAGLVLSIIGLSLGLIFYIACIACVGGLAGAAGSLS